MGWRQAGAGQAGDGARGGAGGRKGTAYEKGIELKKSGTEVHYQACSLLVILKNSCSKRQLQKVSIEFPFHIRPATRCFRSRGAPTPECTPGPATQKVDLDEKNAKSIRMGKLTRTITLQSQFAWLRSDLLVV